MILVVLNGFLGNRKGVLDVTDIVGSLDLDPSIKVFKGRGGSGVWNFNKLRKFVERNADRKTSLCIVGKSYGGHWAVKLLWKLADREKLDNYGRIGLVTVDPSYVLHRMQKHVRPIPNIDYARNIHQYGPRSGYRLGSPAKNIVVEATHANIETRSVVTEEIEALIQWGLNK